jgi:hypothetical protein
VGRFTRIRLADARSSEMPGIRPYLNGIGISFSDSYIGQALLGELVQSARAT